MILTTAHEEHAVKAFVAGLPQAPVLGGVVVAAGGVTVADRGVRLDTFVPRTWIDYPLLLPSRALDPGTYQATVTVTASGRTVTRTLPFTVTQGQYTQVFQGAAPLQKPAGHSESPLRKWLPWLVAFLAVLALAGTYVYRRWIYYL